MSTPFYKQQVGIANLDGDILDVQTNAPLQLPASSILLKACWSVVVPIVSQSNHAALQLVLRQEACDVHDYVPVSPIYTVDTVNQCAFTTDCSLHFEQCENKPNHKSPFLLLSGASSGVIKFTFLYI